jgi:hypothetical protein
MSVSLGVFSCWTCVAKESKYSPKEEAPEPSMNFRYVPEPALSELGNYVRQRREVSMGAWCMEHARNGW